MRERLNPRRIDQAPVTTYLIALAFTIIVIAGAVVTITNPDTLSFQDYIATVAAAAGALGLLAIGRGINEHGKQQAGAQALAVAHQRSETHRPQDPQADMPPPPGRSAE